MIVFKYPGNAKQNFIKRLIGLPGERIRIWRGNIYVKGKDDKEFHIARKTEAGPAKLKAMLQLIDDTNHIPEQLRAAGWPSRWQEWSLQNAEATWQTSEDGKTFVAQGGGESWLRYHHLSPDRTVWDRVENGQPVAPQAAGDPAWPDWRGDLIGDFCAYNVMDPSGRFWVGDLAFEFDANVTSNKGELLLKVVQAGVDYDCRIDIATGSATLSIDGGRRQFSDQAGKPAAEVVAKDTGVRGAGRYHLRFSNVDDELVLWVNDTPVAFEGPTTYVSEISAHALPLTPNSAPRGLGIPRFSFEDPGDMAPAGVGSNGAKFEVSNLRVFRDVYYTQADASAAHRPVEVGRLGEPDSTKTWGTSHLFEDREPLDFPFEGPLGEGQYFPMGDNSPQSKDARLWHDGYKEGDLGYVHPYVDREFLIGKAVFIYWPHPWYGFLPNFGRMSFIR